MSVSAKEAFDRSVANLEKDGASEDDWTALCIIVNGVSWCDKTHQIVKETAKKIENDFTRGDNTPA